MRFFFLLAVFSLFQPVIGQEEQVRYSFPKEVSVAQNFDLGIAFPLSGRSGMARLQMDFPKGFEVQESNNGGALFTYAANLLQLLWVQLPGSDSLRAVVKVRCLPGFGGKVEIPCRFYCIENGVRKELALNSCKFSVNGEAVKRFTPVKREEQKTAAPVLPKSQPQTKEAPKTSNDLEKKEGVKKDVEQKKTTSSEKAKPEITPKQVTAINEQPAQIKGEKTSQASEITDNAKKGLPQHTKSEDGIRFRIQLAASSEKSSIDIIASQFSLKSADVNEELHNGLYKYTTGNFTNLAAARGAMGANPKMKSGCFIAGYENGNRIELEDAIRLSKQK
jgi:hypothetical protein